MKGDFSRFTFDRRKHYTGVRLQQGRVQLDADWNEQLDIASYLRQTIVRDLIGASGAPTQGGGFQIKVNGAARQLLITPGRYYVDGLLCENDSAADLPIDQQPDLPGLQIPWAPGGAWEAGWYLAYLDVWERDVSGLEDPDLLEIALGGPDTAVRSRTVWQVRLVRLGPQSQEFSCSNFPPASLTPPRPTLAARTLRPSEENQLYRIEVHTSGTLGTATFKWSRDNGSVAAMIERPGSDADNPNKLLIVRQIGPDLAGGFAADQWIEVTDEVRLLQGQPGVLAQLSTVSGQELTVTGWPSSGPPAVSGQPVIRRWDSNSPNGEQMIERPGTNQGFLALEGGLEVRFGGPAGAVFRSGDAWTIPVRAASGALWPQEGGNPAERQPQTVEHHRAPLAMLLLANDGWSLKPGGGDCRRTFEPTTSGVGQEKLNRRQDDTMTASLTITGSLSVHNSVTLGPPPSGPAKLKLDGMPLEPAVGEGEQRGIRFPVLPTRTGAHAGFLQFSGTPIPFSSQFNAPRLVLGIQGAEASIVLRQDATDALTVAGGRVGIGASNPAQRLHVEGGALFRSATSGVRIEGPLTFRDGTQGAGRHMVSDAEGRATWKEVSLNVGAPVFLAQRLFVGHGGGPTGWITYVLAPDKVPASARAVILEAEVAKAGPDGGAVDAYILVRKGPDESENILLRARAAGGGDNNAWSNQGLFPIRGDGTFQYVVTGSGFDGGWTVRVVGYFP